VLRWVLIKRNGEIPMNRLEQEYEIYCACMEGTGEYILSFDEWLNS